MDSRTDHPMTAGAVAPQAQDGPKAPVDRPRRRHRGWKIGGGIVALLVLAVVIFLMLFDWDWLRGPIARYASARTGRDVRIEGHLRVHLLTWSPTVRVGGLKIGNPSWAGQGDTAQVQLLTVSVRLLPLFTGQVDLPLLELDQPRFDLLRDTQGRANWSFSSPKPTKPAQLPPIQRFIIKDGALSMKDIKRNMTLTGTINASEQAQGGHSGFELVGKGTMNKESFLLQASGGPLIHVQNAKPYEFHLDVKDGATHVAADGQLNRPFNLGDMQGELVASGPNLAALYPLSGLAFPGTPPYSLKTHFRRQDAQFDLTGINGRVGDSDLEGSLSVGKTSDRRKVTGDLASRRLVFTDFLSIIGGGPKANAVKASADAPAPTPSGRLLPDATLYKDKLKEADADIKYHALSVNTGPLPLRQVLLHLTLDDGVIKIDPLDFEFPQGRLAGTIKIDGSNPVVKSDVDVRVSNIALANFLPAKAGAPPPLEGTLQGRAQLHGTGDTIHKAASTADGRVVLVIPHGHMRQAFAELMGIDVANGLYLLLSKDNKETDLRCAVAEFNVKGGVMTLDNAVFDTGVVSATGKGTVDLNTEAVDLRLDGKPKKPRFLRIWSPITLKGTMMHPKPGIDAGKAAAQIGIAGAVGAVLAPLAAVLPFVEPGLAKDADCAALIGGAKDQGAPIKASMVAAAAAMPMKK